MASSVASTASPAPSPSEGKVLKGRDLINIGIFTAIYFVIQFVFMLCGGIHPALWVFMPALDGLFAGVPFMLMHAGLTWEEAEPRLAAHVERFARAHTAAGRGIRGGERA